MGKGLNLDDYVKEDEVITFGKCKLVVTSDLPMEIAFELQEFGDVDPSKMDALKLRKFKDILIKWLSLKNRKYKVKNFINGLGASNLVRVVEFLTEYLKTDDTDKKKGLED